MSDPIYIVSGFPRSGTSMMMRCLEAGGLACHYDTTRDYEPDATFNPNGFYELNDLHKYQDWSAFRGGAVKVLRDNLRFIPVAGETYRVAYMTRDWREIANSFRKLVGAKGNLDACNFLFAYESKVHADCLKLQALGADVNLVNYADVVANPSDCLSALGWPMDVSAAAKMVDGTMHHERCI